MPADAQLTSKLYGENLTPIPHSKRAKICLAVTHSRFVHIDRVDKNQRGCRFRYKIAGDKMTMCYEQERSKEKSREISNITRKYAKKMTI